ncbi:MAG: holo-ACP synthase [Selenomonas sp.]
MVLGLGTDIIEIGRMEKAMGREAFLVRVFTEAERSCCDGRGAGRAASYAARWAGKEAVLKAFGTGLRQGTLLDVEIISDALGAPQVHLSGFFAALAEERGVRRIHLSLSHAKEYAVAQCILEGEQHEDRFGS